LGAAFLAAFAGKKATMKRALYSASLLILALACRREGFANAFQISNRTQAVGGPSALADIGDFVLENDQIRVAILQGKNSLGPGVFGGSLVDADLRRPEPEFRGGAGLDQWGELFPTANLIIPRPLDVPAEQRFNVSVLSSGQAAGCAFYPPNDVPCAIIRVEGRGDNFMASLSPLATLLGRFAFRNDYVLRPGARHVEIITTIDRLGQDFGDGEVGSQELAPLPLQTPNPDFKDLLAIMIGAEDANPAHADLNSGVATGDFVIFGKRTSIFSDGVGFDEDTDLTDVLLTKGNPVSEPFEFPYLVAAGDRVSYGYASLGGDDGLGGKLFIPLFTSAVTVAFSHGLSCLLSPADDGFCDGVRFVSWRRAFIVGEGDVGSILGEMYKIQGRSPGAVFGQVIDQNTGAPISGAQIFAFEDPLTDPVRAASDACRPVAQAKEAKRAVSFSDLLACTKINRASPTDLGVESEMKSDLGADPVRDGRYRGPLLPGSYFLVAWTKHRLPSAALPIDIPGAVNVEANFSLAPEGRLVYEVHDERGALSPAKITAVGEACTLAEDPERCDPVTLRYGPKRLVFGDSLTGDNISEIERTISGRGQIALEPGKYRVLVSRGIEYSIDEFSLDIPADGRPVQIFPVVQRVVDSSGFISGDFHIHGVNSFDSGLDDLTRVASYVVEGVELMSSSDHDYVTDFAPAARALGVEDILKTQVGLESTTLELGHYIGFPLLVDNLKPSGGAFDWTGLPPGDIIGSIRQLGALAPDEARLAECQANGDDGCADAVVMVPHPRDGFFGYFDQYGVDPITLGVDPGFFQVINPLQKAENFTDRFDAIELLNGKRYDFLRRPTVREVAEFSEAVDAILADNDLSRAEKHAAQDVLSREFVPRVITRTANEQTALDFARDARRECVDDAECGLNRICDPHQTTCLNRVACTPGGASVCAANQVCDPVLGACVLECNSDADCRPDETCNLDGTCAASTCDAAGIAQGSGDRPCPEQDGVIEDWFRFLNFGVIKTGMASSDSHDLAGIEAGLPRTFICSDAESASAINGEEIAAALRAGCAFATTGPFVNFTINGERLGSLVKGGSPVSLRIRAQTPGWFDLERVEVYRNGELLRDFSIVAPNDNTVAFEETFEDNPPRDAWYVVIVLGTGAQEASPDGSRGPRNLSPVYTSVTTPNIAIGEALSAALADVTVAGLRLGDVLGDPPPFPQVAPIFPYAVTNPIYVDQNQNGAFDPPGQGAAFLLRGALSGLLRFPMSALHKHAPTIPDDFALDLRRLRLEHNWLDVASHHGRFK
jgi:hypothetical protein